MFELSTINRINESPCKLNSGLTEAGVNQNQD
jgi:hypothetical protein